MKKIFLVGFGIIMAAMTVSAAEIRGKLNGYKGELVLVEAEKTDTLKVMDDGRFVHQLQLTEPDREVGFFRFGKTPILMRLNDSDRVELIATKDTNGYASVIFNGDRKELNHYLTCYEYRSYFEQWPNQQIASKSFEQHAADVDKMEQELNKLLDQAPENEQLIQALRSRLHSASLNLKCRYGMACSMVNKEPMDKDSDYVRFMQGLDMNDEAWLEREKKENKNGYPALLDGRIYWEMAVNNDLRSSTDMRNVAYLEWVRKLIKSDKIADFLMAKSINMYLGMGGDAKLDETYQAFQKYSTDPEMKKIVAEKYKTLGELSPGKPAPDFEMKDVNGKVYRLSDFRGKMLYIDIWATWCGPCLAETPHFEKRYQQYKNKPDIEFIGISLDGNVAAWKNKLAEDKSEWKQFIVDKDRDSELSRKYVINGIPRFILIDKEGKIITANAPRPSSARIEAYLEK